MKVNSDHHISENEDDEFKEKRRRKEVPQIGTPTPAVDTSAP